MCLVMYFAHFGTDEPVTLFWAGAGNVPDRIAESLAALLEAGARNASVRLSAVA